MDFSKAVLLKANAMSFEMCSSSCMSYLQQKRPYPLDAVLLPHLLYGVCGELRDLRSADNSLIMQQGHAGDDRFLCTTESKLETT